MTTTTRAPSFTVVEMRPCYAANASLAGTARPPRGSDPPGVGHCREPPARLGRADQAVAAVLGQIRDHPKWRRRLGQPPACRVLMAHLNLPSVQTRQQRQTLENALDSVAASGPARIPLGRGAEQWPIVATYGERALHVGQVAMRQAAQHDTQRV